MHRYSILLIPAIFILNTFVYISKVNSAVINASSCSQPDVQSAVSSSNDGDVIIIPAGTCTWNSGISISNKGITIRGAGIDQTVITDATGGGSRAFLITLSLGDMFRITGFTLNGQGDGEGSMRIQGNSTSFRVDNIKFDNLGHRGLFISGKYGSYVYGLIDHCIFNESGNGAINLLMVQNDDGGENRPVSLGTANAVYIEDNTFNVTSGDHYIIDAERAARVVFRYNTVNGGFFGYHGTCGGLRGTYSAEVYENNFNSNVAYRAFFLRGGTGVIFNNTVTGGYQRVMDLTNYRSCSQGMYACSPPFNVVCNGNSSLDGNMPGLQGYPCADQIGRAFDSDGNGYQDLEPYYEWNNTFNGADIDFSVYNFSSCSNPSVNDHIQENRDYYNDTPRPGYTPYPYPHHLIVPRPSPPTNPRIVESQ